jgi:hypothetical protein
MIQVGYYKGFGVIDAEKSSCQINEKLMASAKTPSNLSKRSKG